MWGIPGPKGQKFMVGEYLSQRWKFRQIKILWSHPRPTSPAFPSVSNEVILSQLGAILPLWGHLAMSRGIFSCHK